LPAARGYACQCGNETLHPLRPETGAEPVDQIGNGFVVERMAVEARLRGQEGFGAKRTEADQVETKTGIERIGKRIQFLMKQAGNRLGRPVRARGGDLDPPHRAVDAVKTRFEMATALAARLQQGGDVNGEAGERRGDILGERDRLEEDTFGQGWRHRPARRDRMFRNPREPLQPLDAIGAEAGGKRRARPVDQVGDALQPRPAQRLHARRIQPKGCNRQRPYRLRLTAGRHDDRIFGTRQGPGGSRRAGDRAKSGQAKARQPSQQVIQQRRLALEEMRDAGDVEHHAAFAMTGDQRRIAIAPIGDVLHQRLVGGRIVIGDGQLGDTRPRLGQRQAGGEPQIDRRRIGGCNHQRAFRLFDDQQRRLSRQAGMGRVRQFAEPVRCEKR
jgi:hypothetical protein